MKALKSNGPLARVPAKLDGLTLDHHNPTLVVMATAVPGPLQGKSGRLCSSVSMIHIRSVSSSWMMLVLVFIDLAFKSSLDSG